MGTSSKRGLSPVNPREVEERMSCAWSTLGNTRSVRAQAGNHTHHNYQSLRHYSTVRTAEFLRTMDHSVDNLPQKPFEVEPGYGDVRYWGQRQTRQGFFLLCINTYAS